MHRIRDFFLFSASAIVTAATVAACGRGPVGNGTNGADADSAASRPSQAAATQAQSAPPPQPPLVSAPRDTLTDTVITGRIKAAILTDPAMQGADVSVNTDEGVVVLTGVVKNHEQTGVASAHAQRQDGVMRVDNQLSVAPS